MMNRWRFVVILLLILTIAGFFAFGGRDWRALIPVGSLPPASRLLVMEGLDERLSGLPRWLSSLATLLALFLAGSANLFLFPERVRNLATGLTVSWRRSFQLMLAGLAFGLLFALGGLLASAARLTFPLSIIAGLGLFTLAFWGYLGLAYALGRVLLKKAGWLSSPFAAQLLGLLLLHVLLHLPFAGAVFGLVCAGAGLGIVITTRFGSMKPWDVKLLLEERYQ